MSSCDGPVVKVHPVRGVAVARGSDEMNVGATRCGFADGPEFVSRPPVFDTGDHFDGAASLFAGFDIDLNKYPSRKQALKHLALGRLDRVDSYRSRLKNTTGRIEYGGVRRALYLEWPLMACAVLRRRFPSG